MWPDHIYLWAFITEMTAIPVPTDHVAPTLGSADTPAKPSDYVEHEIDGVKVRDHRKDPNQPYKLPVESKQVGTGGRLPAMVIGSLSSKLEDALKEEPALRRMAGDLTARDLDLIDLHVSQLNGCGYCVSAHTVLGKAHGLTAEQILRIRDGQGETKRDSAVLALARRVAKGGGLGAATEIAQAREVGLTDPAIVEVIAAVGVRALVNAVALASATEIDWPKPPRIPES